MNPETAELVGTICAASALVFGVFRFFLAQNRAIVEEFRKDISELREDMNDQHKALTSVIEAKLTKEEQNRDGLAHRTQQSLDSFQSTFVRRDDFAGRVTEILAAVKDVRDDVNKNFRNRNVP